ncbi:MAG TPA: VOC family protein [Jatrophihabitantaceae bacterium]
MTTAPGSPSTTRRVPLLRAVDCISAAVPDLDTGLAFYRDLLGHRLLWRNDELGQAGVALPEADTELVLTTQGRYGPGWLVDSADDAAETIRSAGGHIIAEPRDTPVGRIAVAADPFGNVLVLLDLSKGRYVTDAAGVVTGTTAPTSPASCSD